MIRVKWETTSTYEQSPPPLPPPRHVGKVASTHTLSPVVDGVIISPSPTTFGKAAPRRGPHKKW